MRLAIICLSVVFLLCACAPLGFPYTPSQGAPSDGDNLPPRLPKPPVPPPEPQLLQDEPVAIAKKHLASRLGIAVDDITVVSVERVDWPDTSLGLPEPDKVFAPVIIPGFKITLKALGEDYVYHAGWIGQQWLVLSETHLTPAASDNLSWMPRRLPVPPPQHQLSQDEPVSIAKQQLASQFKITVGDVTVVSVESVDWPDTSLGLPEPDKMYAQVIVPGFKITLGALGKDYVYHAGLVGQQWLVRPKAKTSP